MSEDKGKGVIAERLDRLFASFTPEGHRYSLREAVQGINELAGRNVVSFQYLSQLRNGTRREPSREKLQAIADWFGVSVSYFFDDEVARRTDEELRGLELMRNAGIRSVMFRMAGVSDDNLKVVASILDQIRNIEGLPPSRADGSAEEPPGPQGQ